MSSDTLRTALAQALAATISDYDKPWHAQSILATPTGKALADVVAAAEAWRDYEVWSGPPAHDLEDAIDRLREAIR